MIPPVEALQGKETRISTASLLPGSLTSQMPPELHGIGFPLEAVVLEEGLRGRGTVCEQIDASNPKVSSDQPSSQGGALKHAA